MPMRISTAAGMSGAETFVKLAVRELMSASYSFGSIMRTSEDWMLEKNVVRTVPMSRM